MEIYDYVKNIRCLNPIVHAMTNYVAAEESANILLALGAKPVCADAFEEAAEITEKADALLINTGTPSEGRFVAALASGRSAVKKEIPCVLDPVGAGASKFRNEHLAKLVKEVQFDVIKGNTSEIAAMREICLRDAAKSNNELAKVTGALILVTGETDCIYDKSEIYEVHSGSNELKRITGGGCMLGAVIAAFLIVAYREGVLSQNKEDRRKYVLGAVIAACQFYKNAAKEVENISLSFGTMSFRNALIDCISKKAGLIHFNQNAAYIYGIAGRKNIGENATLIDLINAIQSAADGGMTMFQLREKEALFKDLVTEAIAIKNACHEKNIPAIINDNVGVCLEAGMDGVHLGQGDMDIRKARRILGANRIIGATAHNLAEALKAEEEGADYIGVGAAFGSTTKTDARPFDISEYGKICAVIKIPVVAIGGINAENVCSLRGRGLSGVAVISSLFQNGDARKAAMLLDKKIKGEC